MKRGLPPRILLVGVGYFGKRHFQVLKDFDDQGLISLVGAVVATDKSKREIEKRYSIKVFTRLSRKLLNSVDGVDVVTPIASHYGVVKKCLDYTAVIVEKPLADTSRRAQALVKLTQKKRCPLMVGHIFRFNEAVRKLKVLLARSTAGPYLIEGEFITPGLPEKNVGAILTFMHHFDILDFLLGGKLPLAVYAQTQNNIRHSSVWEDKALVVLLYGGGVNAVVLLGWGGFKKTRTITLHFKKQNIFCDLLSQEIKITPTRGGIKKINFHQPEPLRRELETFIRLVSGAKVSYPDARVGERVVTVCEAAKKSALKNKVVYLGV